MMRLLTSFLAVSAVTAFAPSFSKNTFTKSSTATITTADVSLSPRISTERGAMLQQTELPGKLYVPESKEIPKVLGGLKIGLRQLVCITGASSGLGLNCAATLAKTGKYFVIMAVRDVEKGKKGRYPNA